LRIDYLFAYFPPVVTKEKTTAGGLENGGEYHE
jgi:hypothetical protein